MGRDRVETGIHALTPRLVCLSVLSLRQLQAQQQTPWNLEVLLLYYEISPETQKEIGEETCGLVLV